MKRGLARYGPIFLAILLLTACGGGSAVSAGGGAEIPEEILGELDEETLEGLVEGPKYVALTFDDGPRRDTTSVLLDGLLERGVSATFFVIGRQIPGNEDLLRRMRAEGHQVGNHTYLHDFYPTSVEAALEIVDRLQGEGYTFVTVEELFRIRGVTPQAGLLYASPDRLRPLEAG